MTYTTLVKPVSPPPPDPLGEDARHRGCNRARTPHARHGVCAGSLADRPLPPEASFPEEPQPADSPRQDSPCLYVRHSRGCPLTNEFHFQLKKQAEDPPSLPFQGSPVYGETQHPKSCPHLGIRCQRQWCSGSPRPFSARNRQLLRRGQLGQLLLGTD